MKIESLTSVKIHILITVSVLAGLLFAAFLPAFQQQARADHTVQHCAEVYGQGTQGYNICVNDLLASGGGGGGSCSSGEGIDFGLPTWYKYLNCDANGTPQITNINDTLSIVGAVIEILLFLAGVLAVFFIVYGGIRYAMSQGEPDKLKQARSILTYAIGGLVLSIVARVVVQFIYDGFTGGGGFL